MLKSLPRGYIDAASDTNSVCIVADGWGFRAQQTNTYISAGTGDVRIFGWTSLGDPLFSEKMEVDLDGGGDLPSEMLLNTKMWEPTTSLISLQVIILSTSQFRFGFVSFYYKRHFMVKLSVTISQDSCRHVSFIYFR